MLMEEATQPFGSTKGSFLLGAGGLLYGLLLATVGMGAANGGDGAMIPLYVFGSPLFLPLLFFAPIVVWPIVTVILSRAAQPTFKKAFLSRMVIPYIGVLPYLIVWGDWDHLSRLWDRSPMSVLVLIASYLVGQVAIWVLYAATQQFVGRELKQRVC